jgi:penicillin amidase
LGGADASKLPPVLESALDAAVWAVADYPKWGDMHRLVLRNPLSFVPLIGWRYEFGDFAAAGGVQTLMKTAQDLAAQRHSVNYGSNVWFVSDLTDLDRNYFTLLGGQDGWFRSEAFPDQVPLWQEGRYMGIPLRIETVRAKFTHKSCLAP